MRKTYKQAIQNLTGWTTEQYNKQYDIFRNKVRNAERQLGRSKSNVAQQFFYTLKTQKTGGTLSKFRQFIVASTSQSTGKTTISPKAATRINEYIFNKFGGLLETSDKAKQILSDPNMTPSQKAGALERYARMLTQARKMRGKEIREKMQAGEDVSDIIFSEDYDSLIDYYGLEYLPVGIV